MVRYDLIIFYVIKFKIWWFTLLYLIISVIVNGMLSQISMSTLHYFILSLYRLQINTSIVSYKVDIPVMLKASVTCIFVLHPSLQTSFHLVFEISCHANSKDLYSLLCYIFMQRNLNIIWYFACINLCMFVCVCACFGLCITASPSLIMPLIQI